MDKLIETLAKIECCWSNGGLDYYEGWDELEEDGAAKLIQSLAEAGYVIRSRTEEMINAIDEDEDDGIEVEIGPPDYY